jgi:hypothetical protein
LPAVSLVFPLGHQLRLWLEAGVTPDELQAQIQQFTPELTVQPLQPTLQDATLRELALGDAASDESPR